MSGIRSFVWGFTYDVSHVIDHLKADGNCDIRVWISTEKRATFSRRDFMMPDLSFKFDPPRRCPPHLYDQVYANFYEFIETIYHRKDAYYQHTLHDYLDYYHQLLDYFYSLFTENDIELVLIENLPHYGADRIVYDLAKAMGLKTVNLIHAMFSDRFFYVYDIHDYGHFSQLATLNGYEPFNIEHKFNQYMDYVKKFKPFQYSLLDACRDFAAKREFYAFGKYARFRRFIQNHDRLVDPDVRLDQPYVYFPLHYQPELSTFPLAGKYVDQILALEALSDLIPDDWRIYVKESVVQSEYRRGEGFFTRLRRLKKIKLVPRSSRSHELSQNAVFTATLTGTAGWESLCFGKNTLVFGQPWYLTLPGVFRYDPGNPNLLSEILNGRPDQNALEAAVSLLVAKAGKGEICYWYSDPNFDKTQNVRKVADSLHKIIENHPSSREILAAV